ncbi:MAG: siderophore-interacting protein [Cyanobacteria bacterium J06621_8]
MPQINCRSIVVKSSQKITPNMQRVTFTGDELADFPENYESGYVKFLFSNDGQVITDKNQFEQGKYRKDYITRTYTVRGHSREENELSIEFSLNRGKAGIASTWAESAKPGDKILITNPGSTKLVNNKADWFLLAGDMSGLPALCCNLEQLPENAQGYAVIEIVSESDKQMLTAPDGIAVRWVVNPETGKNSGALIDAIQKLTWKEGNPYIWVACNFDSMKKIRAYMKKTRNIKSKNIYISSYWKFDRTEEEHRIDKRKDSNVPLFLRVLIGIVMRLKRF